MILQDRIYGQYTINSPVLIDLINSKSIQRLKNINQFGIPDKYYFLKNFSRYEHSIGVLLLLKKLGASTEEQIAGLLHDVSHTAFSHVIDFVYGSGQTLNYQDSQHKKFVLNSEIPNVLKKYGYNPSNIIDFKRYKLLEQPIPDLCVDRIDYALREYPINVSQYCLKNLKVINNKILFADEKAAYIFAKLYLKRQIEHWGSYESTTRYNLFANMLKYSLNYCILDEKDFWQDDAFILNKLYKSEDDFIKKTFKLLEKDNISLENPINSKLRMKFRYVDPLYSSNGELNRLSKNNSSFSNSIIKAKKNNNLGFSVALS